MRQFLSLGLLCMLAYSKAYSEAKVEQTTSGGGQSIVQERLLGELDFVSALFKTYYAPKEWKESFVSWDLEAERQKAKAAINQASSVQEYRQAMVNFFNSAADYHVGFAFVATEKATLPFSVRTVEGKVIVVYVEEDKLSKEFGLGVGDEITAMNDRSVETIYQELAKTISGNVPATDLALQDNYFTHRAARKNVRVPRGTVVIDFVKPDGSKKQAQLIWDYTPEQAKGLPSKNILSLQDEKKPLLTDVQMSSPVAMDLLGQNPFGLGGRESMLGDFGSRIWSTSATDPLDAYIYKQGSKLVGVVRIPSYVPSDYEAFVKHFGTIILQMQENTDALIIEQLNNPGGAVLYLYTLASMLTDQPLVTPRHRMALTQDQVAAAIENLKSLEKVTNDKEAKEVLGETLLGYPISFNFVQMIREYCRFVIDHNEAKTGERLTPPYYIVGVDRIHPSPVARYTKPIFVLVNELDFSGGDFFPAILQDNKRATIVGTRTAGAGGYVLSQSFPNSFGLSRFSFTGSLAERVSKNPIENLGVTPDVELKMTLNDFRSGFSDYKKAVKELVNSKLE